MPDEEQKKIFARNLNRYLELSNKTQREVAEAIGVIPSTFNTWCQGIALPRMGKVQALADYFNIGKTDLIDEKNMSLTTKDEREIGRDLDRIMKEIEEDRDGPLFYNGEPIDEESLGLLKNALELGLRQLKTENKEKYNPYKNKKK